jgi:hypothetical protein
MIGVIRLLVEEEIHKSWNSVPLIALCTFYKKDNFIDIVRILIEASTSIARPITDRPLSH